MTKESRVLGGRKMNLADYTFARWGVTVPSGTTLDDVLHPAYFRNYTHQIQPGASISVLSDDMVVDVELRVTSVTKTAVHVRCIRNSSMSNQDIPEGVGAKSLPEGIEVDWGGPSHKFRVKQHGKILESGFGTKDEAKAFAEEVI